MKSEQYLYNIFHIHSSQFLIRMAQKSDEIMPDPDAIIRLRRDRLLSANLTGCDVNFCWMIQIQKKCQALWSVLPRPWKSAMDSASSSVEEFDDLPSSGNPTNHSVSQGFSSTSFRIFERSKRLFSSGLFLKGSAIAVGFWNPEKGFRAIMVMIVLLLDVFYLFGTLYYAFVCKRLDTPLNSWFCVNTSTTTSSSTQPGSLHGIELHSILSLVSTFATLMSNAAFFWCMWKLRKRSVYCVTAFSTKGRSIWVTLNCTILAFGLCLVTNVFWFGFTFKGPLFTNLAVSLTIIPQWAILTSSWIFHRYSNKRNERLRDSESRRNSKRHWLQLG